MKSMNPNRRFNSIARRIQRSWQWKKLWQIVILNLLALVAARRPIEKEEGGALK